MDLRNLEGASLYAIRNQRITRRPMSRRLSDTNPYLRDPAVRERMVIKSVVTSSAIDGIRVSFEASRQGRRKLSARKRRVNGKNVAIPHTR